MIEEATIVHEAAQVAENTGGIAALGIDLKIFIAQLINFAVVLFVLWKWAYTPILKILKERSVTIENSLKNAEAIESRLSDLAGERETVLNEARQEADKILAKTKIDAEKRGEEMMNKVKIEVENIVASGKNQLQQEKEMMLRDARKDMIEITLVASQKILRDSIDENKAKIMAAEVVDKMI